MKDTGHTVKAFGDELDNLIFSMNEMKDRVIDLIKLSEKSLIKNKEDFTAVAKTRDKEINNLEDKISEQAITLLALRQPMASDLRFIVSSIKIVSLLERMGDRGKKSVKKSNKLSTPIPTHITDSIGEMNNLVIDMINKIFDNIQNYKYEALKAAYKSDDKVDDLYLEIMKKIIKEQENKTENLEEFIALMKIVKNFERVGDYATKIAKIIHYIMEGVTTSDFS